MYNMVPYRRNQLTRSGKPGGLFSDSFFRSFFDLDDWVGNAGFRVDIKDEGEKYSLECELPGVKQQDIEITIDNDVLTIAANLNSNKKEEKENYLYSERRFGRCQRAFNIEEIKQDDILASYTDGILKVSLPKKETVQKKASRKIDIS